MLGGETRVVGFDVAGDGVMYRSFLLRRGRIRVWACVYFMSVLFGDV